MPGSDLTLSIGYWVVNHKATLKRWWAILFLLIMVLAGFWVLASMTVFFAQEGRITSRMVTSAQMIAALAPSRIGSPVAVRVGTAQLIARSADRGDLVSTVHNPNSEWGATDVRYHFTVGSTTTPATTVAVNPGQTRTVSVNNTAVTPGTQPRLVIDSVRWGRGSADALDTLFAVEEVAWTPTRVTIAGSAVETVTVRATMRNTSVYNYFQVDVPVVVRSGETVVAVDELRLDRWASRETKTITLSWPYRVTGVTAVEVQPTVDQLDSSNRF